MLHKDSSYHSREPSQALRMAEAGWELTSPQASHPTQAGPAGAGCPGPSPLGFWNPPRMETPHSFHDTCPIQDLATLTVKNNLKKKHFLAHSNFTCFSLCPLPLILSGFMIIFCVLQDSIAWHLLYFAIPFSCEGRLQSRKPSAIALSSWTKELNP